DAQGNSYGGGLFGFSNPNASTYEVDLTLGKNVGYNSEMQPGVYNFSLEKFGGDKNAPFKMELILEEINYGRSQFDNYPHWPEFIDNYLKSNNTEVNPWLANRNPNEAAMLSGMLKTITYPTGGKEHFTFEGHRYKNTYDDIQTTYLESEFSCSSFGTPCSDCQNNHIKEVQGVKFDDLQDNLEYYRITCSAERIDQNSSSSCYNPNGNLNDIDCQFYILDEVTNQIVFTEPLLLSSDQSDPNFTKILKTKYYPGQFELDENHTFTLGIKKNSPNYLVRLEFSLAKIQRIQKTENVLVGGLRIKEIKTDPISTSSYSRIFSYNDNSDPKWSSGELIGIPAYLQFAPKFIYHKYQAQAMRCQYMGPSVPVMLYFKSNTSAPLGSTEGMHIGYKDVQIEYKGLNEGYTNYSYYVLKNLGITFTRVDFPVSPEWYNDLDTTTILNGKLRMIEHFDEQGNSVHRKRYLYNVDELVSKRSLQRQYASYEVCQAFLQITTCQSCPAKDMQLEVQQHNAGGIARNYYLNRSFFVKTVKTIDSLDGVKDTIINQFHPQAEHVNIVSTSRKNSDGKVYKTDYTYALEEGNTQLLNYNFIDAPLTERSFIDLNLISGKINDFDVNNGVNLKRVERLDNDGNRIFEMQIDQRNTQGQLLEYHGIDAIHYTTIRSDYFNGEKIIAKAKNAELDQVAYSGFENTQDKGGWDYNSNGIYLSNTKKVGAKSYRINGRIIQKNIPSGKYNLEFWIQGSVNIKINGNSVFQSSSSSLHFERQNQLISASNAFNTIEISGTGYIDELRLYPEDSYMESYSYDKVTGDLVSLVDINFRPRYFAYDEFHRLVEIKDHNGYIVSRKGYLIDAVSANNTIEDTILLRPFKQLPKVLKAEYFQRSKSLRDGIGREMMSIAYDYSPKQNNVISYINYDLDGNSSISWLPFTHATEPSYSNVPGLIDAFYDANLQVGAYAFSQTVEGSPLNRPNEISKPGFIHRIGGGRSTRIQYRSNFSNEVLMVQEYCTDCSTPKFYDKNSLYVTTIIDGNGNKTITYKDKVGNIIQTNNEGSITYNVYDRKGRLVVILPPEI
ncbi:MAG: DUF6443 domain-containing protein, partial [Flavobacteriales bacterium]|nr:DUF6443 domain-containing protein [Flavobacteriales bacterium]